METKKLALGTLAYTAGTFTLAVVWHILLFEDQYRSFGYIEGEPNFAIGFVTILLQGVLLSLLFPMFRIAGTGIVRGLKFVLPLGAFFWSSHVLAFIAKQTIHNAPLFVTMETVYLGLQFGLFGVLMGLIHRGDDPT